jgi:hypothetical protein
MGSEWSYPLQIEGTEKLPGSEENFAKPSVTHLRQLMRHLFENQEEAKDKGIKAREFVVNNYSQEKVAAIVLKRLSQIEKLIKNKES